MLPQSPSRRARTIAPTTAIKINSLATLYRSLGQTDKAEPLFQRCLEIREARLGKNHPEAANTLHSLAALYHDLGQYARAEPLYQRALAISKERLGPKHPTTRLIQGNYDALLRAMGK